MYTHQYFLSSLSLSLQISYEGIGNVQMTFLRLLHSQASQNFTYLCMNSVAWYDTKASTYSSSLKFLGYNDQEFGYSVPSKPVVARDGCKVSKYQLLYKKNLTFQTFISTEKIHSHIFRAAREKERLYLTSKQRNRTNCLSSTFSLLTMELKDKRLDLR